MIPSATFFLQHLEKDYLSFPEKGVNVPEDAVVDYDPAYTLREGGCLADIAPTLIEMMGKKAPAEMTGQ